MVALSKHDCAIEVSNKQPNKGSMEPQMDWNDKFRME